MKIESKEFLPVEIVFHPNWWYHQTGLKFDRDHFYNPERRVKDEMIMRRTLWELFGEYGYGEEHPEPIPVIGPVHIAAGYMMSSIWGCRIDYFEDSSPVVVPQTRNIDDILADGIPDPMNNKDFRDFRALIDTFMREYGYVVGDFGWGNLQNLALDLMGQNLFLAYFDSPEKVHRLYDMLNSSAAGTIEMVRQSSGTTSVAVNRSIVNVDPAINLQSNCSVQMISNEMYEEFLLPHEIELSKRLQPYGIHHCGDNMHTVAEGYSKVKEACFFDVGWGSDIGVCREKIPEAFFNVRLSPVKIRTCTPDEVEDDLKGLLENAGDLSQIGVCCINMDNGTPVENVSRIFEVVEKYRSYGA